ncbi:MAG TPA: AI-2E family transporter [Actinomycetes bacterium]|jgi:predicted PurR-regulated permease PerM|nr:AI-2E family transporter [Actinomycetes bacterium]
MSERGTPERREAGVPRAAPAAGAVAVPPWLARSAAVSWRLLVVAGAVAVVAAALVYLRLVVLPVVVALFLATLLAPPVRWLRAHGWPPLAATWTVIAAALLLAVGLGAVLAPQIGPQFGTLRDQVGEGLDDVQRWLREGPLHFSESQLSELLARARQEVQANSAGLTRGVLTGATLAVEVVTGALLSLVLTFFFVKDGERIGNWIARHTGSRSEELREVGRRAFDTLGAYLRGVALVGLVDAVLIGIGLAVIGVPLAVPLAFLVFLGAFFPIVGAFVSGVFAALVALVSKGVVAALIIVAITVAVQQLEGHVLAPVVLGRAVKLHPVVILLALTGGGVVGGIAGAALAVPAVAVATSVASYLHNRPATPISPPAVAGAGEATDPEAGDG